MNEKNAIIPFKRWISFFICSLLALVILFCTLTYLIDPLLQFRSRDNSYKLNSVYVSPGLVKNYDYDTLMIGSSMIQNFNMDLMRRELNCSPLHIGIGGLTPEGIADYISLAQTVDKADTYYICIDTASLCSAKAALPTPEYLMHSDPLSTLQYLLGYEAWFKFTPVDMVFCLAKAMGISLGESIEKSTSIDLLENWSNEFVYGEEFVIKNYIENNYGVSNVDLDNLYSRMEERVDEFIDSINFEKDDFVFFFPPYSSLYWCNAQKNGYFEDALLIKDYFIERAAERGAVVYDFQPSDFTMDLNNYKDTTHFTAEINDYIVRCFSSGECIVTQENRKNNKNKLIQNTESFRNKHSELFKQN